MFNPLGDFAQTRLASTCYVQFNSKEDCYCYDFLWLNFEIENIKHKVNKENSYH